ncbi:hypothetical protein SynBIOSE41_00143 [Synechococcus sp. BIOS-E4-1]|nr:hypothetical protein SynBIOSE41_00143 [Synechococcus sp. BIOS-E4-1]
MSELLQLSLLVFATAYDHLKPSVMAILWSITMTCDAACLPLPVPTVRDDDIRSRLLILVFNSDMVVAIRADPLLPKSTSLGSLDPISIRISTTVFIRFARTLFSV